MKKIALVTAMLMLVVCLAACGSGISISEGKETFTAFLECIKNEDYDGAAALSHSENHISASKIKDYVEKIENNAGVDFSNGVEITLLLGFRSYISTSGASLEMNGRLNIDGKNFAFEVEFVRNNAGYGICYFNISQVF